MQCRFSFLFKRVEYIPLLIVMLFWAGYAGLSEATKSDPIHAESDAGPGEGTTPSQRCLALVPYHPPFREASDPPVATLRVEGVDPISVTRLLERLETRERSKLFFTHRTLVLPSMRHVLEEFVTHVASPPFYALTDAKGNSMNIFILPTVHTIPFVALPPYLRHHLATMVRWPKVHVIGEVGEDYGRLEEVHRLYERVRGHPDYFLDRTALITAEADRLYTAPLNKFDVELREQYIKKGYLQYANWFEKLDEEAQNFLLHLYKRNRFPDVDALQRGDLNPKIILACLKHARPPNGEVMSYWTLDSEVERLFLRAGTHVFTSLETEKDRVHAQVEGLSSLRFDMEFLWDYTIKELNQLFLQRVSFMKERRMYDLPELRSRKLIDLQHHEISMTWMFGKRYSSSHVGDPEVEVRNRLWWERTIERLVDDRLAERERTPVLLLYGAAHNDGKTGILPRMVREKHMRFFNLTRDGWREGDISQFLG